MFSTSKFLVNPPSTVVTDPYFRYTTLLLNDTGTNGAQNNTFIDSSTNNFTITRNGNTTQGSFNPYMPTGYWGGYFDNASYLSVPSNAALTLGTGTYTIECWIYNSELVNSNTLFTWWNSGADRRNVHIGSTNINYASQSTLFISVAHGMVVGQWYHIALTYDGTTTRIFVNGVVKGTYVGTQMFTANAPFYIGAGGSSLTTDYFFGYISNFRVIKGTCLYTSNFTPATTPLISVSGTSLLCLQDNRFKDNSSNNFTITPTSTSKVTHFNPFAPPASYTTSAYGGSAYFDGNGDYLNTPINAALDLSGDFTIECWVYPLNATGGALIIKRTSNISAAPYNFGMNSGTGAVYLSFSGSSNGTWNINPSFSAGTKPLYVGTWNHVAAVKSGTTITCYVNGQSDLVITGAANLYTLGQAATIGANDTSGGGAINAYVSNMRVVKGTAVYTSNFTPPTAPLTAISGTSLLLNATNAGIYDATTLNDIETVADAKVSTAQAKWGSSSMFFDGTGDYLYLPKDTELDMGSGNFTIEWWMYPTTTSQNATASIIASGNITWSTGAVVIDCGSNAANKVRFVTYPNGVAVGDPNAWTVNTWTYFAVVRNGNTLTLYRNGTSVATNTSFNTWQPTVNFNYNNATKIAGGHWDGATSYFTGYIEDLRITKGIARYTSNFTAPTAAFPTR